MNLTALIMAGGLGTRMKIKCEKPLIKIMGKPMLQWIVEAVKKSKAASRIIVAVSKNTPKTAKEALKLSIETIETPGEGYINDYQYAIKKLKLKKVLILPSDLPLINSETIREIVDYYVASNKPALSVMIPLKLFKKLNLTPEYIFNVNGVLVSPVGVNIVDGEMINEAFIEQKVLILDKVELAVNVNTIEDLKVAAQFLYKKENF
jgi:adenosylcobinamide-phosphate guanylyltransferase